MAITNSGIFSAGTDPGVTGTGKRAYYAYLSRNTSSTWGGCTWYGPNINSVFNVGYETTYTTPGPSHVTNIGSGTYQYATGVYQCVDTFTQSNPGSDSGRYIQGTNNYGEFGNATVDAYSDGTLHPATCRNTTVDTKWFMNLSAINSDHLNKRIVYILRSGVIRATDRLFGNHLYPMAGTRNFTVPSLDSSMTGSASYHRVRKELTILSFVGSSGSFNCFTYQNVDFDAYPDPFVALNRPEVVRVDATLSLASSWAVNDSESYYNVKPITTDNGNVYVTVFFTSNNLSLYRFTRSGTSAITATYITSQGTTTSYGRDQGDRFGQKTITSRDGTSVAAFCPYYYYGCGIKCYMIDKTNNTYTAYAQNGSSIGIACMPYGDSSWGFWYNGNSYASNYSGGYMIGHYTKRSTGGFASADGAYYAPYHPGPNTTNYPGMTQVTDYMLLPSHVLGAKNT
jgi:hypothetical protein